MHIVMSRPVLVKLGGSVITDKQRECHFHRAAAKRLVGELAKADVPAVLLHGAGSFGHPAAKRHRIGVNPVVGAEGRAAVSGILADVGLLHAQVVELAHNAGLKPVSVPIHLLCQSEGDDLMDFPVDRIMQLLREGHTPVLSGTLVRDDDLGWRVVSADELMATLAEELEPRLAVFATNVDGVHERDPLQYPDARLLRRIDGDHVLDGDEGPAASAREDVTGRMAGKLLWAGRIAHTCPVLVLNGTVRSRLLDALKGKDVTATRIEA